MGTEMTQRVDNARDTTAGAMRTVSKKLRSGSKTAARAIQHGGARGADVLEASGRVVRTDRPGTSSRRILVFALVALALGVLAAVLISRNGDADTEPETGYAF